MLCYVMFMISFRRHLYCLLVWHIMWSLVQCQYPLAVMFNTNIRLADDRTWRPQVKLTAVWQTAVPSSVSFPRWLKQQTVVYFNPHCLTPHWQMETSHELGLSKKICHQSSGDMKVVFYDEPHDQNQFIQIVTSLEEYLVWSPVRGVDLQVKVNLGEKLQQCL